MSFVIATPEMLTTAATDLAKIGSTITAANTAAAAVAKVLPASADEVSVAVAALFGTHAQEYQTVSAQVATFHDRFVQTLSAAASSYVAAEAVNVEQSLLAAVNAPTQALFGRPLIGNGPAGLPGAGCSSRPITDQRATQQRLGGRIEGIEHVVLQRRQRCGVGRLRADIRADRGA